MMSVLDFVPYAAVEAFAHLVEFDVDPVAEPAEVDAACARFGAERDAVILLYEFVCREGRSAEAAIREALIHGREVV